MATAGESGGTCEHAVMGVIGRWRNRWRARRRDLALRQIEADRVVDDLDASSTTGGVFGGQHYAHRKALGGFLNPRAKSQTEWRGD